MQLTFKREKRTGDYLAFVDAPRVGNGCKVATIEQMEPGDWFARFADSGYGYHYDTLEDAKEGVESEVFDVVAERFR